MVMENKKLIKVSKYLSKILRHNPERIGLKLNNNGWAEINELLNKGNINIKELEYVVKNNDKKRFEFSKDRKKIRACQGHSINIDLKLEPKIPPKILYHGTSKENIESIKKLGLDKMNRDYVHLSSNYDTAIEVGKRHGNPTVLTINSQKMHKEGAEFYLSTNRVWLTEFVPINYIKFRE